MSLRVIESSLLVMQVQNVVAGSIGGISWEDEAANKSAYHVMRYSFQLTFRGQRLIS